jgi:Meckel syndrome type 1 protein
MLDPWRTLGLPPGAPAAEVKRAYRRLAKAFHPDSAGPAALSRFLQIQAAYEALATPRAPRARRTGTRADAAAPAPPPAAPPAWQADPARARASGTTGHARTRAAGSGSTAGANPGAGATESGERPKRRGRPSKRATFGSTTYDEARDQAASAAADEGWSGASWYGPSSGEYWTINPREYADPRKHGPEYQARAQRATSEAAARSRPGPAARATRPPRPPFGTPPSQAAASPSAAPTAGDEAADVFPSLPTIRLPAGRTRTERVVLALLAWPPIGLLAASLIGAATGCARYAASCEPGAEWYPWLAQSAVAAALIGLASASARIGRALAAGTIALLAVAVPAALLLAAAGATWDPINGPSALSVVLGLGWLAGVLAEASGWLARRRAGATPV